MPYLWFILCTCHFCTLTFIDTVTVTATVTVAVLVTITIICSILVSNNIVLI